MLIIIKLIIKVVSYLIAQFKWLIILIQLILRIILFQTLQEIWIIIRNQIFKIYNIFIFLISILIILKFMLLFFLLMRILELSWTLTLESLDTLKTHNIIVCLNIWLHRNLIIIWRFILKNTFKSLATSTLTLKQFIRNLINNIFIRGKVIIKHMLPLKSLRLIVISSFLFIVCWNISLYYILTIYFLKYNFLRFVIINEVRLHFWAFFFFFFLIYFSGSFFSLEKLLKEFLFFLSHWLIIK